MADALVFVMLSLASYRVWRLVGKDDITGGLRVFFYKHLPKALKDWFVALITCPWCAGTWIALLLTWATDHFLRNLPVNWFGWAVAVSCVVGLLSGLDDD